jgi:hypothetical protein
MIKFFPTFEPGGGTQPFFLVGMCHQQNENGPKHLPVLRKNGPMYLPLSQNFLPFRKKFTKIGEIAAKNCTFLVDPYIYHIWLWKGGHWFTRGVKRGPMFAAHPRNLFSTELGRRAGGGWGGGWWGDRCPIGGGSVGERWWTDDDIKYANFWCGRDDRFNNLPIACMVVS